MSKSKTISLVIADEQPVIRSGLHSVFADSGYHIVAEAATGKKALSLTRKHKPDLLLLDVLFSDFEGFAVLDSIQKANLDTRVVMLSGFDSPTYVARAITHGAWDFVLKNATASEIRGAVERASRREPPNSTSVSSEVRRTMNLRESHTASRLTAREAQVLRHLALGLSNREVGTSLGISVETVKEHVQSILRKTKSVDRTPAFNQTNLNQGETPEIGTEN